MLSKFISAFLSPFLSILQNMKIIRKFYLFLELKFSTILNSSIIQWKFWRLEKINTIWLIGLEDKEFFSSVQLLSRIQLFVTLWTAAHQISLSITNCQNMLKLMSIELVMPSNHLILCHPLLLLPSIFPSIRVFSSESILCIRWSKYWSFSFSISPSNEYSELISFKIS